MRLIRRVLTAIGAALVALAAVWAAQAARQRRQDAERAHELAGDVKRGTQAAQFMRDQAADLERKADEARSKAERRLKWVAESDPDLDELVDAYNKDRESNA